LKAILLAAGALFVAQAAHGAEMPPPEPRNVPIDCEKNLPQFGNQSLNKVLHYQFLNSLEWQQTKAESKRVADELRSAYITDGNETTIANYAAKLFRERMYMFYSRLSPDSMAGAPGWKYDPMKPKALSPIWLELIMSMPPGPLAACFPDFVGFLHDVTIRSQQAAGEAKAKAEQQAAAAEQHRQKAEAEARRPENQLVVAYANYIGVRRCYEARQGFLAVNISDPEMDEARDAVKQIEQAFVSSIPEGTTTDQLWQYANKRADSDPIIQMMPRAQGTEFAPQCRIWLQSLRHQLARINPDSAVTKKDF
jgi:hypothetical protein